VSTLRIAKTIGRGQIGAKRQTLQHGDELVCVRHRIDPRTNTRYVTVELISEWLPVVSRDNRQVAVRIGALDKPTRILLLSYGATWDPTRRLWLMPRSVARTLRLLHQIIPTFGEP